MELQGRVALITGGRRIGRQLASEFARRGMKIALTYHTSAEIAAETKQECERLGSEVLTLSADLRETAAATEVVSQVVARWGRVDVLANLVSIYHRTPLETLTSEQLEDVIEVNLLAPMRVAVAVAQQMKRQPIRDGLQGKMIHFTDWAVSRPYREYLPYLVAKGGLETLTRALAVELAPTITVNAIAPGTVEPPPQISETKLGAIRHSAALQRIGSPADVIRATLYLLEGTDFVTGEVFRIDGGRFLGPVRNEEASGG